MANVVTFNQAIADSQRFSKRHLLLGNGFSIACRADIFHYASLYGEADFSVIPEVLNVFQSLNTQDFEVAIRALESASRLLPFYVPGSSVGVAKMQEHAAALKEVLVKTIAENHPQNPNSIEEAKFWSCQRFLSHFLAGDRHGCVFTLNYDLLLYWTLMHERNPIDAAAVELDKKDSFGNDEVDPDTDYVVWQGETAAHSADVYFLHGALHLFDAGSELQKYTWARTNEPLVDQARTAIAANKYPLFVAEGTSGKKKDKIRHNAYLYQCFKVLTANADTASHCFFIFGHSLAANDDHILRRLGRGKCKTIYVSLYGDPNSPTNLEIIARANALKSMRNARYPLEVTFYDATSARVWEEPA